MGLLVGFGSRANYFEQKAAFVGVLMLLSGLVPGWIYAWRGVDSLSERYLLIWIMPFIGAALAISGAAVFSRASRLEFIRRNHIQNYVSALFLLAALVLTYDNLRAIKPTPYDLEATRAIENTVETLAGRASGGGRIALKIDRGPSWGPAWSAAVAVIAAMNRSNRNFLCVESGSWHLLFHRRFRCHDGEVTTQAIYVTGDPEPSARKIAQVHGIAFISLQPASIGLKD